MNYRKLIEAKSDIPEAFNGHKLQQIIGILAITLPVILIVGYEVIEGEKCGRPYLSAISAYYHTYVGTYFTGVLFAIAMAMLAYKGKRKIDEYLATFAALMALGVAIYPTTLDHSMNEALGNLCLIDESYDAKPTHGIFHYISAALLFVALAVFCFLFRISDHVTGKWKKLKDAFQLVCAILMIVLMIIMLMFSQEILMNQEWFEDRQFPVILIGETICLFLFGASWLVEYTNISDLSK